MIRFLQGVSIFKEFNETQLSMVADLVKTRMLKKGTHIFFQDEPMREVFILESGVVKIYQVELSGKEQIINILNKDAMFPHRGIFEETKYPANAVVYEDARILCFEVNDFWDLLMQYPGMFMAVMKIQNKMITELLSRLNEKMMHDTREQVIKLLLRLTKSHGQKIKHDEYKLMISFTNQELANMIGSSRETINRTLTNLKKQELIYEAEDGKLVIHQEGIQEEILY